MNTPSVKTLSAIFGEKAKEAKLFLTVDNTRTIKTTAVDLLRSTCFNPPGKRMVRLTALNELGDFHGVESLETVNGEYAEYLNADDTYAGTLIFWRGKYRVQSVGDFVETMERNGINFK